MTTWIIRRVETRVTEMRVVADKPDHAKWLAERMVFRREETLEDTDVHTVMGEEDDDPSST